jgi:arginyl-tRNA synthetase (EC 6.1.1.19)
MFRAFRAEVTGCLREALAEMGHPGIDIGIEEPPGQIDAALASSVAFRLADLRGEPPQAVAEAVVEAADITESQYIAEVSTAGPYVNFSITAQYLTDTVRRAMMATWGQLEPTDTSVIIEHTSANPTGPIHVGRARNPIFGDALARVLSAAGATVERQYYVNDAGRQVATFTWAVEHFGDELLPEADRDRADHQLVRYYRYGSSYLEEADPADAAAATASIDAIMQGLEAGDQATYERVHAVIDPVLEGMSATLRRLGVEFDRFVEESKFIRDGSAEAVIGELQALPESEKQDGAWMLDLTDAGIDKELVFVRGTGPVCTRHGTSHITAGSCRRSMRRSPCSERTTSCRRISYGRRLSCSARTLRDSHSRGTRGSRCQKGGCPPGPGRASTWTISSMRRSGVHAQK